MSAAAGPGVVETMEPRLRRALALMTGALNQIAYDAIVAGTPGAAQAVAEQALRAAEAAVHDPSAPMGAQVDELPESSL